jgi:hypothetical protein
MKRILITIIVLAAAISVSHAQDKYFRWSQYGDTGGWIDEAIIGDAIATGKEAALKQMRLAKDYVARTGNAYVYWRRMEKWFSDEGWRRYSGIAAKTWGDTCWNTFIQTIAENPQWLQWYNGLPHHAKIIVDQSVF